MGFAELKTFAARAGVPGTDRWTPAMNPQHLRGAPSSLVVDGVSPPGIGSANGAALGAAARAGVNGIAASRAAADMFGSPGEPGYCSPNAIIPEPGCAELAPDEPTPDNPPPEDPSPPADPGMGMPPAAAVVPDVSVPFPGCYLFGAKPYRVVRSIRAEFYGECNGPVNFISIRVRIERGRSFLWGFIWRWTTVATAGPQGGYGGGRVSLTASGLCDNTQSYYRGAGSITVLDPRVRNGLETSPDRASPFSAIIDCRY